VLEKKNATSHPSHQAMLPPPRDSPFDRSARVVVDGNIITSQGPGTSLEFSLELVKVLYGPELAAQLAQQMVLHSQQ
jgi:protein deglycase